MKSFWSAAVALLMAAAFAQPAAACTSNAECDDANVCNGAETCQGGICVGGTPLICDDMHACTTNTCEASAGCVFLPSAGCMVSGRKIKMGARNPENLRLTLQAEPEIVGVDFPANNTSADPVINGATLRIFSTEGDTFDATYPMPDANWDYIRSAGENAGYKYKDLTAVYGPIRIATIRNGKPSKFKGGGAALGFSLGDNPNPVNAVVQVGDKQYCLSFGGNIKFNPGTAFKAKKSPAPPACPFP